MIVVEKSQQVALAGSASGSAANFKKTMHDKKAIASGISSESIFCTF